MRQLSTTAAGFALLSCIGPTIASPADHLFDWVTINDAGNAGYDRPSPNPDLTGRGSVSYEYRIARREVSSQQYLTFLNTFATQSDTLGDLLEAPVAWGGERDWSYTGPGKRYKLRNDVAQAADLPTLGIDWRQTTYFINWMNNDLSSDPAAIENGAYDTSTYGGDPQFGYTDQTARNGDVRYFLPTWDEALKAAHYDPNKFGEGQGGWWIFNDGSDTQPIGGPPGVGETSANWRDDMFGGRPARETPLGSYPGTTTPWGLLDASGGGVEWTETWAGVSSNGNIARRFTGAGAGSLSMGDNAAYVGGDWPTSIGFLPSFRIASVVPSPSTLLLGCICTFTYVRRSRS